MGTVTQCGPCVVRPREEEGDRNVAFMMPGRSTGAVTVYPGVSRSLRVFVDSSEQYCMGQLGN